MRFITDTLGVKLVTRQLPAESRALLRALLIARARPLPAAWLSLPQTANGPASAAEAGKRSHPVTDGSDVTASLSSAVVPSVMSLPDSLGTCSHSTTIPGKSSWDFSNHQPAQQCELPDCPLYVNGCISPTSQQQQQQHRAPTDAGIPQMQDSADPQDQNRSRVGSGGQTSAAQEARARAEPATSFEALQGLLQKVSSVLQGAVSDRGVAPLEQVNQQAGLPPGL